MYRVGNIARKPVVGGSMHSGRRLSSQVAYKDLGLGRYIQKSPVNSYIFQNSLPRLPVPKLEKTLERYVDSVTPLVSAKELSITKKVVREFGEGVGQDLHKMMVAENKANKHTSWLSKPWFDMYLKARAPLPINYNPYISYEDYSDPYKNEQINKVSCLIFSSIRFKATIEDEVLKPDVFHLKPKATDNNSFLKTANMFPSKISSFYAIARSAFPLDMSQFQNLFCSTRLPYVGRDKLRIFPNSRHIVVMFRNRFYEFDVIKKDGSFSNPDEIKANLLGIKEGAPKEDSPVAPGLFTTMNRDDWANARKEFIVDAKNAKSLERIDSAIFVVSLDDKEVSNDEQMSRAALFGNGQNRWFDKSFSLVALKTGDVAVNFEHAWGDGVAVLRYLNETYQDSERLPCPSDNVKSIKSKEISFNISPTMKSKLEQLSANFSKLTNSLTFSMSREIGPIGREHLKKYKIGADSICQFSFQLAYYRLFGKTAATYESANTAAFKHGRTETIRPNTVQTLAAAKAFLDPSKSNKEKYIALKEADKKHNELVKNGVMGQGFDRHLFKLKVLAEQNNIPLHELYTAGGTFDKMNNIILSTSTLQSPAIKAGGFCPTSEEGFGVGYSIFADTLGLHITSFNKHGQELLESVDKSMYEIRDVLEEHAGK